MEVRVKLHLNNDLNIQNAWMCLNYEKNPSIGHLTSYISKNFGLHSNVVKLYLDEFWLPPWESSKLLRENDCIKVMIEKAVGDKNEEPQELKTRELSDDFLSQSVNIFVKKSNASPSDNEKNIQKSQAKVLFNNLNSKKQAKIDTKPKNIENFEEGENEERYEEGEQVEEEYDIKNKVSNDLVEKIAQSIYKTGTNKWKNSTKAQMLNKKPTHIIFESDSATSSSSSSSSDSSEEEDKARTKQNLESNEKHHKQPQQQHVPKWKTKKEQLDAKSYNRSFKLENGTDLKSFKKEFNRTKYMQPKENPENGHVLIDDEHLFEQEKYGKNKESKSKEVPVVDYTKYDPLVGSPFVDQKIAFQVLELNDKFEPHISDYKTGRVTFFDENSKEIRLHLNGTFNEVLNKPNKFTIVEETKDEANEDEDCKQKPEEVSTTPVEQDEVSFEWSNLLNVRLVPQ